MRRGAARLVAVLVASLALAGCRREASSSDSQETDAAPDPDTAPALDEPAITEPRAFIELLAPLPDGARSLVIRYQLESPTLRGDYTVSLRSGGYRHERWRLASDDGTVTVAGTTIATPAFEWTAADGEAGERRELGLDALARAWQALPADAREAAVTHLRSWQRWLADARSDQPGPRGRVLNVDCLEMRIAGQNLCMWEQAMVALRYEGAAFSLRATEIRRDVELDPGLFELPPLAADARRQAAPALDVDAALDQLVAGQASAAVELLVPSLRLPAFVADAPNDAGATP